MVLINYNWRGFTDTIWRAVGSDVTCNISTGRSYWWRSKRTGWVGCKDGACRIASLYSFIWYFFLDAWSLKRWITALANHWAALDLSGIVEAPWIWTRRVEWCKCTLNTAQMLKIVNEGEVHRSYLYGMEWNGIRCLGSRLLCLATDSLLHQGDPRPGYQNRSNTRASRTSLRDRRQPVSGCNTSVSLFYSYCVCSTMCLLFIVFVKYTDLIASKWSQFLNKIH